MVEVYRGQRSSRLALSIAAIARMNGIAMGTGLGMPEKRANARVELGADDVLEPACLSVRLGFVDGKSVFEQTLSQAMAAHYVARALAPRRGKLRLSIAQRNQMPIRHARKNSGGRLFRHRSFSRGSRGAESFHLRGLPFLAANPNLLEQVVKANFLIGRDGLATVGCVHQRTAKRLTRAMHCRVKMQVAVSEFDAAVGLARDVRVMRDHQDRVTRLVQLAEDFNDDSFIGFVEIAGWFVGKYELRLVDQCAGNGHALLFATG